VSFHGLREREFEQPSRHLKVFVGRVSREGAVLGSALVRSAGYRVLGEEYVRCWAKLIKQAPANFK
jgi:hypothetical protein